MTGRGSSPANASIRPLLAALVLVLSPAPAHSLDYIDTSPSGAQFPEWEGGRTVLRFADVNADGNADFVSIGDHGSPFVNTGQHGIMVYFGDGAGGWSIHMEGDFGYGGIDVGDANNDGLLDVCYGMHHNYSGVDFGNQLIEVAIGDGTGMSWTPWDDGLAANGETYGMFATRFADMDNDGDLDLASNSFGCCNGLHVYRNAGDGTWTQTWASSGGNSDAFLTWGDVSGDGILDFAATYQGGTIWLGDGRGSFTSANTGLPGGGSLGLAGVSLGDVDGDGCADLSFVQNGGVYVYVWRMDHWEAASTGLPSTGSYAISFLHDMNADGLMDVSALGGGTFTVWFGDGAGNWSGGGGFDNGPASASRALEVGGDVDHNGFPDVVLLQQEGAWPSYQNHLYAFRESSTPGSRFVAIHFPWGNETLVAGSARTIRWSAAHLGASPASITIELSVDGPTGPWAPVAADLPDGGHYQWIVPDTPSDDACIRITLVQGAEIASAVSRAFRITPNILTRVASVSDEPHGIPPALTIWPNPVRATSSVTIGIGGWSGALAKAGRAWEVAVSEPSGRTLRRLVAGEESFGWDLSDREGRPLPSGVYLVRLVDPESGRTIETKRLVLIR